MKLDKKKNLAAKVLKVGRGRIVFIEPRLEEIKEAITKEDIRSLKKSGAIMIKPIRGKKGKVKRKTRKSLGNVRKWAKNTKREYMIMTRKQRAYVAKVKEKKSIKPEEIKDIRNKIRNRHFKSLSQLKDYIKGLKK